MWSVPGAGGGGGGVRRPTKLLLGQVRGLLINRRQGDQTRIKDGRGHEDGFGSIVIERQSDWTTIEGLHAYTELYKIGRPTRDGKYRTRLTRVVPSVEGKGEPDGRWRRVKVCIYKDPCATCWNKKEASGEITLQKKHREVVTQWHTHVSERTVRAHKLHIYVYSRRWRYHISDRVTESERAQVQ